MALEIERKFLVATDRLGVLDHGERMMQGFIATADHTAVRVRVSPRGAWLTLKGASTGATRSEFEYAIPAEDARQMLGTLCSGGVVEKTRYRRKYEAHEWEIDVFHGDNDGLVVAEVELATEDEQLVVPPWAAEEVTDDPRYYNLNLAAHPFSCWGVGRQP